MDESISLLGELDSILMVIASTWDKNEIVTSTFFQDLLEHPAWCYLSESPRFIKLRLFRILDILKLILKLTKGV